MPACPAPLKTRRLGIALLLGLILLFPEAGSGNDSSSVLRPHTAERPSDLRPKRADFGPEEVSPDARLIGDWIVHSGDNRDLPFIIVDKPRARIFVFGQDGRLRGTAPVLLGLAGGDYAVPGIGKRNVSDIRPHERTTPAGRFVAVWGRNTTGEKIIWVDHDAAVSMHRIRATNSRERRLQRLASPTIKDNRITYGCINLPAAFFAQVVETTFVGPRGIVYILPETLPARQVFGAYDIEERASAISRRRLTAFAILLLTATGKNRAW